MGRKRKKKKKITCPICGSTAVRVDYGLVYCNRCNSVFNEDVIEDLIVLHEEEEKEKEKYGEEFDSGFELIDRCPYMSNVKILLPPLIMAKIKFIVKTVDDYEFTAFLPYYRVEDDGSIVYVVRDIIIPKQKVTSASVDVDPNESKKYPDAGIIHYHPFKGKPSFSYTDEEYSNTNRPFSIVISKDMKMTAVSRVRLPCGYVGRVEAEIVFESPLPESEKEKLRKSIEENIEKKYKRYNRETFRGINWI